MPAENPGYVAAGDIYPCRFVKPNLAGGSNPFQVVQATAGTDQVLGVSTQRVKHLPGMFGVTAPYKAAEDEDPITVYGDGEQCLLESGAAFTGGDYLISDANGKGVPCNMAATTTVQGIGARALEAATAAGQIKRVLVTIRPFPGI